MITNRWIRKNIRQNHGSLGEVYPRIAFAMEGDTPSFLNLVSNGLRSSQNPTFGGWGGRYYLSQPIGETRPIYTDSLDTLIVGDRFGELDGDINGIYTSNKATIWRWREAYQNDFAVRMDWASTANYEGANHPPVVKIEGKIDLRINGNEKLLLNASGSYDPDGDELYYYWFHYKEAGGYTSDIKIHDPDSETTHLSFNDPEQSGTAHIILEVKDDGKPCLYRYGRFILYIKGTHQE
jgi:hypothetical protein